MKKKGVKVERLVQSDRFEIRKISMENGSSLPPHTSPKDAFLQMLSGHIQFHIQEERHDLKNTDSIAFPAQATHHVHALKDAQFLIIR